MPHGRLRHDVRLEPAIGEALLQVGLLREHVEALIEGAGQLDRRATQHERTAAGPIDGSRRTRDALLDASLAERDEAAQAGGGVGKMERRGLVSPVGIDDARRSHSDLRVRVEVRHEGIDCPRLDRGVVVEEEVIRGVTTSQQAVVVGTEAVAEVLGDEIDVGEVLAHRIARAVLGGIVEHVECVLDGGASRTGQCSQGLQQEVAVAVGDDGDGELRAHRSSPR